MLTPFIDALGPAIALPVIWCLGAAFALVLGLAMPLLSHFPGWHRIDRRAWGAHGIFFIFIISGVFVPPFIWRYTAAALFLCWGFAFFWSFSRVITPPESMSGFKRFRLSLPEQGLERRSVCRLYLWLSLLQAILFIFALPAAGILPAVLLALLILEFFILRIQFNIEAGDRKTAATVVRRNEELRQSNEHLFTENKQLTGENDSLLEEHNRLMQAHAELREKNARVEADLLEQMRISNVLDHLRQSVEYARRIQTGILYSEKEITDAFPEAFMLQKPRDVVSGDFCWFTRLSPDQVILAAIDCTGHGVPGAFMTIMGNGLLHNIVNEQKITRPDQILFMLDRRLRETLSRQGGDAKVNDGMDMALCHIDFKTGVLLYSGARNPLCLIRSGEIELFKGTRKGIGGSLRKAAPDAVSPYELHQIRCKPGDVFYIYSDGFQDQLGGEKASKYMSRRFRSLLLWNHSQTMPQQKRILENELHAWQRNQMQTDDVLVIGFKVLL